MSKMSSPGSICGSLSGCDMNSVLAAIAWIITSCQLISAKSLSDHTHLSILNDRRGMRIPNCSETKKEGARHAGRACWGTRASTTQSEQRGGYSCETRLKYPILI